MAPHRNINYHIRLCYQYHFLSTFTSRQLFFLFQLLVLVAVSFFRSSSCRCAIESSSSSLSNASFFSSFSNSSCSISKRIFQIQKFIQWKFLRYLAADTAFPRFFNGGGRSCNNTFSIRTERTFYQIYFTFTCFFNVPLLFSKTL